MRSSMRTITDVNFDGRAVDLSKDGRLTFLNNCDKLAFITIDFYDMDTHARQLYIMGDGYTWSWKRGDTVIFDLTNLGTFFAGHDYMGVPNIYQSQTGASESETSPGQYDVYMGAGRIQQDSSTTTEVYIDKDISFIVIPVRRDSRLIGGCVLRLSDRDLLIESYDASTGLATVSSARINGSTYSTRITKQGEPYKLITNYLWCDTFCFYYRSEPEIKLSYEITKGGIEVTGTYSQAQGTALQSWKMRAEYSFEGCTRTIAHETNFVYTIKDTFPLLCDNEQSAQCTIYCEITTQDGQTAEAELPLSLAALGEIKDVSASKRRIIIPYSDGTFVWRQERQGEVYKNLKYIGNTSGGLLYTEEAGNGQTYRYIACSADSNGKLFVGISDDVTIQDKVWSIQHLTKINDRSYTADHTNYFTFSVDIAPGAIETVTGNMIYGSEGRFPKYIHGSDRYDTGSFTAVLGSIASPEASAYDIERWCEYISQEGPFLLRTDYGDVKIVAITSNPARQYGGSLAELGITRVTYSWAEIDDIDEVRIL